MKTLGLLFSLLLLALGIFSILSNFAAFAFHWKDFLFFLIIALIVYVILLVIGSSLNKKFDKSIKDFLDGSKKELFDDRGLLRTFGLLLITLLPFLIYLFALALFAAIDFAIYGLVAVSYVPYIPIALLIGLGVVVVGTGLAILIGFYRLFFPRRKKTLGFEIGKNEKKLRQLTKEIATEIEAKPIDKIIITPDPGIGVYLDGNLFAIIFGGGKRVLEIGLSSLHKLTVSEFKAILAHEYGHFSNRDTHWGSFTYSMGNSLISTLQSTPGPSHKEGEEVGIIGGIMSLNPAYWMLRLFVALYFKITNGFSRIGEVMADMRAMKLYGGKAFADGLLKVSTNDTIFNEVIQGEYVPQFIKEEKTISNFSKFMEIVYESVDKKTMDNFQSNLLSQKETHDIYDSHPALKVRIDYAKKFDDGEEDDKRTVDSLFDDWDGINEKVAELYNLRLVYLLRASDAQTDTEEEQAKK